MCALLNVTVAALWSTDVAGGDVLCLIVPKCTHNSKI